MTSKSTSREQMLNFVKQRGAFLNAQRDRELRERSPEEVIESILSLDAFLVASSEKMPDRVTSGMIEQQRVFRKWKSL